MNEDGHLVVQITLTEQPVITSLDPRLGGTRVDLKAEGVAT